MALNTMINSVFHERHEYLDKVSRTGFFRRTSAVVSGFVHCVLQSVYSDNSENLSAPFFRVAEFWFR